jgi:DNA uptake protein ComE-like DNA-binding protein
MSVTSAERKALLFLAALIALGGVVRLVRSHQSPTASNDTRAALAAQIARVESAGVERARSRTTTRTRAAARRRSRPAAEPPPSAPEPASGLAGPVDVDRAGAEDIELLPWIGPVVASRIVANRDSFGPFGSIEGLERVRGIGPRLADRLRPHVTFSGKARPLSAVPMPGRAPSRRRRTPGLSTQFP